jgi:hypothetical protein
VAIENHGECARDRCLIVHYEHTPCRLIHGHDSTRRACPAPPILIFPS